MNKHGFHMLEAMRYAVEQINNNNGPLLLLPGLKLGYQLYDSCSIPAGILASLDVLDYWSTNTSAKDPNYNNSQRPLAVIGPDSSSRTFTPAVLLGAYLIPQVSSQNSHRHK